MEDYKIGSIISFSDFNWRVLDIQNISTDAKKNKMLQIDKNN